MSLKASKALCAINKVYRASNPRDSSSASSVSRDVRPTKEGNRGLYRLKMISKALGIFEARGLHFYALAAVTVPCMQLPVALCTYSGGHGIVAQRVRRGARTALRPAAFEQTHRSSNRNFPAREQIDRKGIA